MSPVALLILIQHPVEDPLSLSHDLYSVPQDWSPVEGHAYGLLPSVIVGGLGEVVSWMNPFQIVVAEQVVVEHVSGPQVRGAGVGVIQGGYPVLLPERVQVIHEGFRQGQASLPPSLGPVQGPVSSRLRSDGRGRDPSRIWVSPGSRGSELDDTSLPLRDLPGDLLIYDLT